ncbi:hypothetical protein M2J84_16130 [Comamonas aquatica]|uniref:hypothetical protein n=1 Tax=Comamonas aquatica TaxID=225991 RepID=UPI0022DE0A10|nr:hypothetical protein [Comamonas aquatica]WBM41594.1 hypothetical protein M2J84_16130 [Comamonas aquatica]
MSLKIILFLSSSVVIFYISKLNFTYFLLVFLGSFFSLFYEHQEIFIRFKKRYKSYSGKIVILCCSSPIKIGACFYGRIDLYLFVSLVEVFFAILVNSYYVRLVIDISLNWIVQNSISLTKTFSSGFLIFTFFRLDQFFVFAMIGSKEYSIYAVATRFNEVLNSFVGLYSRLLIPKIYSKEDGYREGILKISIFHILLAIASYPFVYAYIKFWIPSYYQSFGIYALLSISGLALIFGQIRGIYFVKRSKLMPDIYNAIFGMSSFVLVLFFIGVIDSFNIAIAYLVGFLVSGFITTFIYRTGIDFWKLLLK